MKELKLVCPVCKGKGKLCGGEDGYGRLFNYIVCSKCHAKTRIFFATDLDREAGENSAKKAWNEKLLSAS